MERRKFKESGKEKHCQESLVGADREIPRQNSFVGGGKYIYSGSFWRKRSATKVTVLWTDRRRDYVCWFAGRGSGWLQD